MQRIPGGANKSVRRSLTKLIGGKPPILGRMVLHYTKSTHFDSAMGHDLVVHRHLIPSPLMLSCIASEPGLNVRKRKGSIQTLEPITRTGTQLVKSLHCILTAINLLPGCRRCTCPQPALVLQGQIPSAISSALHLLSADEPKLVG